MSRIRTASGRAPEAALQAFAATLTAPSGDVGKALDRAAAILKATIQRWLSKPGTGRYYPKRQRAGSSSPRAATARQAFNRQVSGVARGLNRGGSREGLAAKVLRALHRASAPGEPPAPDTGTLRRSVYIEAAPLKRIVGVAAKWAAALEFGTLRIKPRPFMRPALDEAKPLMGDAVVTTLRRPA